MSPAELLKWQWEGYARYHQHRTNLLLHICVVPLFVAGSVLAVIALVRLSAILLLVAIVGIVLSIVVQGRGHALEIVPPEPFTGPANFIGRLLLEQWITFPRFVLSGGWSRNLSGARKR
jgi:hypothetical protein